MTKYLFQRSSWTKFMQCDNALIRRTLCRSPRRHHRAHVLSRLRWMRCASLCISCHRVRQASRPRLDNGRASPVCCFFVGVVLMQWSRVGTQAALPPPEPPGPPGPPDNGGPGGSVRVHACGSLPDAEPVGSRRTVPHSLSASKSRPQLALYQTTP